MTLKVLPFHLASHQWSFPNHRADGTTLTLCNSSGTCQHPASSLFFPSSTYGNHTIQLELRPKGNFNRKLLANASVKRNDESSRGSSKPSTEEELLKSILLASGNSPASQNSDFEVVESDPKTEVNPDYDVFDYSENQGTLDKLKAVHLHVLALEQWNASRLQLCHRDYVDGATNLIHYLALKGLDIEHLKKELSSIGLHNLDTNNSHILASITMGIQILQLLNFYSLNDRENLNSLELNNTKDSTSTLQHLSPSSKQDFTITKMRTKATLHQELLLGRLRDGRTSHIMVTVGREAIENETLVSDLVRAGATTIRINCAHGDPSVWSEIISRVRRSSQMLEKPCRILMDLAGPKLRTGDMGTGPSVMKISPKKDASGNVILPAEVWLSHTESGPPPAHLSPDAALSIDNHQVLKMLELGSVLRFHDARGKLRLLKISKKFPVFGGVGCVAECTKTAYVESGTALYTKGKKRKLLVGRVVNVPGVEQFIRVRVGDSLIISRDPCLIPRNGSSGSTDDAPRITCSSSHLFDSVKPGDPIAFDDGKIWGVIQGTSTSEIIVSITHANPKGSKLGSEKSINIPKSDIRFEGLTSKDLVDLDFVASHADMVGISFVRDVRDVVVVQRELEKRKLEKLGVILKIETQSGFENLPLLLLQAMRSPNPLGIMIARGDLAVECGWEALADIQEEIMSICNAALIPVIWATQVLESLVKSGLPTRAEITDVACGKRASCIMLNKGKCIVEAVSALDSILDTSSSKIKTKLKPLVLSSHP